MSSAIPKLPREVPIGDLRKAFSGTYSEQMLRRAMDRGQIKFTRDVNGTRRADFESAMAWHLENEKRNRERARADRKKMDERERREREAK